MKLPETSVFVFEQELQSDVDSLEDSKDELLEHADFIVTFLKTHSGQAAEDTDATVKELVEAYEKWVLCLIGVI